jgi:hypothetical protein
VSATGEVGRALFATVEALDVLGIRYAVVGGLAVGAWGVNRSTRDADLYADLRAAATLAPLQRALEARGFHVPAMNEELERFGVFRSRSAEGVFVDVFSTNGPLGAAILDRRKRIDLQGRSLWFIAADDLIVLKAFSERPRDTEDLANLLAVGRDLDLDYVLAWAKRLDASIGGNDVHGARRACRRGRKQTKRPPRRRRSK